MGNGRCKALFYVKLKFQWVCYAKKLWLCHGKILVTTDWS